jgi:hypothetical protein
MYADYELLAEKCFCDLDSEHLQICTVTNYGDFSQFNCYIFI